MIKTTRHFARALTGALLASMVLAAMPAQAQELAPQHVAIARKYVDLTDRAGIFEVALVETAVATMRQISSQNPTLVEQTDEAIKKTLETYRARKDELLNQFARVYALSFTEDELTQIVTFYETPVGRKLTAANPTINSSVATVMSVFQRNLQTEFFASVRAELAAAGFNV
ncbi:hypothetical protein SAMN02983003_0711 [Devosia enhydra]|uniref:DUF2059 domain-containing protein n=1 Tax=Devosia enhydra TaxID=665118 RepID=A0A1K2HU18_9HYPH|nr:DUF2059 domain-containing protein [Devosia enhydra]SFZ81820.1 hypothetical protein SAMN02983003_0711 [Devosia enhydra]